MKKNNRAKEQEFSAYLNRMPQRVRKVVSFGWVKFNKPKFWDDTSKVIFVTKVIKAIIVLTWIGITLTLLITSVAHTRKNQFDIHSFDQSGNIKWIEVEKI